MRARVDPLEVWKLRNAMWRAAATLLDSKRITDRRYGQLVHDMADLLNDAVREVANEPEDLEGAILDAVSFVQEWRCQSEPNRSADI